MRRIILTTAIAMFTFSAHAEVEYRRESNGAFYVLMKSSQKDNIITTLSRREGPSGVNFTLLENDCKNHKVKNIAEGDDDVKNMIADTAPHWYDIVDGSSKSDLWNFVCKQ